MGQVRGTEKIYKSHIYEGGAKSVEERAGDTHEEMIVWKVNVGRAGETLGRNGGWIWPKCIMYS